MRFHHGDSFFFIRLFMLSGSEIFFYARKGCGGFVGDDSDLDRAARCFIIECDRVDTGLCVVKCGCIQRHPAGFDPLSERFFSEGVPVDLDITAQTVRLIKCAAAVERSIQQSFDVQLLADAVGVLPGVVFEPVPAPGVRGAGFPAIVVFGELCAFRRFVGDDRDLEAARFLA